MKDSDFAQKVIEMDESVREIGALDELYCELVGSRPQDEQELAVRRDEAKFARDRVLKLSLHVKNLVSKLETHETLK